MSAARCELDPEPGREKFPDSVTELLVAEIISTDQINRPQRS